MKPTFQQDVIESTIQSDYDFSIKQSAHAFQVLSNSLYSNKILAVVREYLTNALDAQIASGVKTPFSVTLPSDNELLGNNYWQVRDYGTGLSEEDIKEFYCTYFSSSKQSSNDFTGMLGLGCKSAFAYTQEFTVTSWFKGAKTDYFVYVENGLPKLTKLGSEPSDEPNGLMVSIYVKQEDVFEFIKTTNDILQWFPQEYIPVGLRTTLEPTYESNTCIILKNKGINYGDTIHCLMGNVVYPINVEGFNKNLIDTIQKHEYKVILKFPIGSLSILPSREGLSLDITTKKALQKKINICTNELKYRQKHDSPKKLFDSAQKIGNVSFIVKPKIQKAWEVKNYVEYQRINGNKTTYSRLSYVYNHILDVTGLYDKNYFIVVPINTRVPIKTLESFGYDNNVFVLKYRDISDKKRIYKFLYKFYSGKIYRSFKDFIEEQGIEKPSSTSSKRPVKKYTIKIYKRADGYTTHTVTHLTLAELRKIDGIIEVNWDFPAILRAFPDILDGKDVYYTTPSEIRSNLDLGNSIGVYTAANNYLKHLAECNKEEFVQAMFIGLLRRNYYTHCKNKSNLYGYNVISSVNNSLINAMLEHYNIHHFLELDKTLFEDKFKLAYDEWIKEIFAINGLENILEALINEQVLLYTQLYKLVNIPLEKIKQHMENYICKILQSSDTQ